MQAGSREVFERRVRDLAAMGHRGSATEQEDRAADYLLQELSDSNLEGTKESFMGCPSLGARLLLHVAVSTLGVLLLWTFPLVTVILGVAALVSMVFEFSTRLPMLGATLLRTPSRNVVATIPAPDGEPQRRVVVVAHYDTQRTGLFWRDWILRWVAAMLAKRPRIVGAATLPVVAPMVVVPVAGLLALVWPTQVWGSVVGAVTLVILAVICLFLADWAVGAFVPGASDNATGSAAVIGLAEAWADDPVAGAELVVLLSGCEEAGLLGAAAWLELHASELGVVPTCFLNVDSLGYGRPRFVGCEHSMACEPIRYPGEYLEICAAVAAERGLESAGPHQLPVSTDGLAFLVRQVPGVSLLCFDDDHHMANYHQLTDTADRLDFDVAWEAVGYAWAVLQRMARLPGSD